ncbi:MAG: DNA gyrase/topoisomerase IV subunit B [Neolewinella sp.]|jgi:DNA gyrase/topoisomerase IV subunit B
MANLLLVINVKFPHPFFEGATKTKLGNKEILEPIEKHVSKLFYKKLKQDNEVARQVLFLFRSDNWMEQLLNSKTP